MFQFLKKKESEAESVMLPPLEVDGEKIILCSPMEGRCVSCKEISDLTFQQEMIGKGTAIQPVLGKVYAPADGKIDMTMETMHAFNMTTEQGVEVMVHVGVDTVALKGKYFKSYIKEGLSVKRGDLLLEFDLEAIKAEEYDVITPVVICNSEDYTEVERMIGKELKPGETLMKLTK